MAIGRLANIRLNSLDQVEIWRRTATFLGTYDRKQISYVPEHFRNLVTEFVNEAAKVCCLITGSFRRALFVLTLLT